MKKILSLILILVMDLSLVSCGITMDSENIASSDNTSEPNKNDTRVSVLTDIIMNNIEDWEHVSDDYTRKHTYDELDVSNFYLFSTDKQNEYYFVTGYTLKNQGSVGFGSEFSYGKVYYLKENSFEYLYNSGDEAYYSMIKNSALFGTKAFSQDTVDKREYVKRFLEETLQNADKYYAEINIDTTRTINLSESDTKLFNNLYSAISALEEYAWETSGAPTMLPLAKFKYYDLGDGKCEMLMYYGSNLTGRYTVTGYYVDENGYSTLSNEDEEKLENTTSIKILEWNIDWTSEKKEYMLKESIGK